MSSHPFLIRAEHSADAKIITTLTDAVFGPAMYARAAFALREGIPHEMSLSFVAELNGEIVGSVRQTVIYWGDKKVLMLGPIGVINSQKGKGAGRALMEIAVAAATEEKWPIIMLVGDREYYSPFGFQPVPWGKITLPRPADPNRILACELKEGTLATMEGAARKLY